MNSHFNREEYNKLIEKYNYKEMLHDAFKQVITPEYKKHGFKKKGKTFYREREGIIEICEVQYSRGNHRTTASFTYNTSIAIPSLYTKLGIQESDKLNTIICGLSFGEVVRWAYNLPASVDDWYYLEAYSQEKPSDVYYGQELSEAEISKQKSFESNWEMRYNVKTGEGFDKVLVEDIEKVILHFFKSIPDAESLIEYLRNNEPKREFDEQMMYQLGHLYYENGEQEKGREILKRIRNGAYKVAINDDIESERIVL
ncbi:DUF4304 domain-containing protein [Neobacillus drentensis]|uniref:DUF4304 domain-containing protein n=1 Tax=Neobacillus drentensis TaxID=220684 RepID=UPI002FFEFB21